MIKLLKSFQANLQTEVLLKENAALLQVQAAPSLPQLALKESILQLRSYLVHGVATDVVDPLVCVHSSSGEPSDGRVQCHVVHRHQLIDPPVRYVVLVAKLEELFDVQPLNFLFTLLRFLHALSTRFSAWSSSFSRTVSEAPGFHLIQSCAVPSSFVPALSYAIY